LTVNIVFAVHVVPMQTYGAPLQSVAAEQVVLHAPVPHAYGTHDTFAGVTHALLALQVAAGVSVAVVQVAAVQTVPAAYLRHAPLPLQDPSVPHVDAPWSAH
jgi:hypothetical protein